MAESHQPDNAQRKSIEVWDSRSVPPRELNEGFRSILAPLQWTRDPVDEHYCERIELARVREGSIGLYKFAPHVGRRTVQDIGNSSLKCYIAALCISGTFRVEQDDHETQAQPGDIVVYDSEVACCVRCGGDSLQHYLGLIIPKDFFSHTKLTSGNLKNKLLPRKRMHGPLMECASFVVRNFDFCTDDELTALFDACAALIPFAAGAYRETQSPDDAGDSIFRELIDFIDTHLCNPDLSAAYAASRLGLTDRYLHKVFARRGTTFGSFVLTKRLDRVAEELRTPTAAAPLISEVAFRWGFNDLSSFNRSFKQRFGWTPRQYRRAHR